MTTKWTVLLKPTEEGGYTARVAEYPAAISEGMTTDEARANVLDSLTELLDIERRRSLRTLDDSVLVQVA